MTRPRSQLCLQDLKRTASLKIMVCYVVRCAMCVLQNLFPPSLLPCLSVCPVKLSLVDASVVLRTTISCVFLCTLLLGVTRLCHYYDFSLFYPSFPRLHCLITHLLFFLSIDSTSPFIRLFHFLYCLDTFVLHLSHQSPQSPTTTLNPTPLRTLFLILLRSLILLLIRVREEFVRG